MIDAERPPRADFHTHSTASDGTLAPGELVRRAAQRGLSYLALTDHDSVRGVHEALATGAETGVVVIAGVELSVDIDRGELHILGYGIDPEHPELVNTLASLRDARANRARHIIERLDHLGISIDPEVLEREHADDSIGRPHIARALIRAGVVESVGQAFDRYLGAGRPAFVPKARISPADAIELIRGAGGIAVMAHPRSVPNHEELLPELVSHGLAGLECYYGAYETAECEELARLAGEHGLLCTGGSDYHGPGTRAGRELGEPELSRQVIEGLLERLAL